MVGCARYTTLELGQAVTEIVGLPPVFLAPLGQDKFNYVRREGGRP